MRHGGVMRDFLYSCGSGQQFVQVPTPAGGVQGVAVVVSGGVVENVFDPTLYPLGGLGLGGPDGGENLQNVFGGDGVHLFLADPRPCVGLESADPLPGMLGILPGPAMGADVAGGTGGECGRLPRFGLPCLDGVKAVL